MGAAVFVGGASDMPALHVDGQVRHTLTLTLAQLEAMPAVTVEMGYRAEARPNTRTWTGVLLWDLVRQAGPTDDGKKNAGLRHAVLAHGRDGYVTLLAVGEIDPDAEGKRVILAYRKAGDTADLQGLRLVVPGDARGPRQVHDVVEIEIR